MLLGRGMLGWIIEGMIWMRLLLCVAGALALAGCAVNVQSRVNPADYAAYQGTGDATIDGQGFLRQNGGAVVTCAGELVRAVPATPYTREVMSYRMAGRPYKDPESLNFTTHGVALFAT
jgi:hypothetical protein